MDGPGTKEPSAASLPATEKQLKWIWKLRAIAEKRGQKDSWQHWVKRQPWHDVRFVSAGGDKMPFGPFSPITMGEAGTCIAFLQELTGVGKKVSKKKQLAYDTLLDVFKSD